jgi:hypothetical protein
VRASLRPPNRIYWLLGCSYPTSENNFARSGGSWEPTSIVMACRCERRAFRIRASQVWTSGAVSAGSVKSLNQALWRAGRRGSDVIRIASESVAAVHRIRHTSVRRSTQGERPSAAANSIK